MTALSVSPRLLDELWDQGYTCAEAVLDGSELALVVPHLVELAAPPRRPADARDAWWEPAVAHAPIAVDAPPFQELVHHDLLRSVATHVLGPYEVTDLRLRATFPGHGHQPLDAARTPNHVRAARWEALLAIWSMSAAEASEPGALRVVPGSHRAGLSVVPTDLRAHPDEVSVPMPPGSVVFLHPRLLHGETLNRASEVRLHLVAGLRRLVRPVELIV